MKHQRMSENAAQQTVDNAYIAVKEIQSTYGVDIVSDAQFNPTVSLYYIEEISGKLKSIAKDLNNG